MNENYEYFKKRMDELEITPEWNIFKAPRYKGRFGESELDEPQICQIFEPDENGNIKIHYYSLYGSPYTFKKKDTKFAHAFTRTRLKEPIKDKEGHLIKYLSPSGSGLKPFFNPSLTQKFQKKEKIPVLFFIEGEFKSFKGYMCGLDIVGLPSIHGFYDEEKSKQLHYDIRNLIITCEVEKIVFITDADTLEIHYEPEKDLYNRPNSFYNAVRLFREASEYLINDENSKLKDVYFAHLLNRPGNENKGLDDLLINHKEKTQGIISDLHSLAFAKEYFYCINISDGNLLSLRKYFGLTDETEFYKVYGKIYRNKGIRIQKKNLSV